MSLTSLPFPNISSASKPPNVDAMIADLLKMSPEQRQQFAQLHMDDPISLSLAKFVDNQIKDQAAKSMQAPPMTPVNRSTAQSIGQPAPASQPMMTNAPQPAPVNPMQAQMQSQAQQPAAMVQQSATPPMMAANGGSMHSLPENSGIGALPSRMNFADGGIVGYDQGGTIQNSGSTPFAAAIASEGITDPTQLAFLQSIYGQESGGGVNTTTSNRGAVGGMQVRPLTFKSVADEGMDINNPVDNARAGIRYALQGYQAANGNPVLAGAYYYGGPEGMAKAQKNIAVSDPKNPNNPNTLQYGQTIAARMANLLPIGSAQAQGLPVSGSTSQLGPDESVVGGMVVDKFGIPIRKAGAYTPSPAAPDTRSIFEKGADYLGIPAEAQRNVSNTINALGGFSAPASSASRVGAMTQGLEATPEMVANAAATAAKVAAPRLVAPAAEGVAGMSQEAQALRAQAIAARQARALELDQQAANSAQQSVNAANRTTQIANRVARGMDATDAANAAKVANATDIANGVASANILGGASGVPESQQGIAALKQSGTPNLPVTPDEQGPPISAMNAPSATTTQDIAAQAKTDPSSLTSDDWLALAAGLLSNKSQYASEALGSGLASLVAGRQTRGKLAMEQQKIAAEAEEMAQRGRYYGAQADIMPQKAQMWADKAASMAQGITDRLTLGKMNNLIAEGKQLHSAIPGTPEGIAAQARLNQITNELASLRGNAASTPATQNVPMTGFTVTPRGG